MTDPRHATAPGVGTEGGAEAQQGRADSSILPLGTPTFCGTHEQARYACGCAYPYTEWTQCLDCDGLAPRTVRRCNRCLDALLEGLKRRAEAQRRMAPLETAANA